MLFQAVVFESAFEPVSGKEESLYNSLSRFLRNVCESGVILIDDQGEILNKFRLSIQKWNDLENFIEGVQGGSDLNRLLRVLEQKNRLLRASSEPQDLDCASDSCRKYLEIALSRKPEFLITDQNCFQCVTDNLPLVKETKVVKIGAYDHNPDFCEWVSRRGRSLKSNEWTQEDFEKEILVPLFRSTENVFLLDQQMGKYFHNNPGYGATVKWLLQVFKKYSRSPDNGLFELHVNKKGRPDILEFEREMKSLHPGFAVRFESHPYHDRFLRTDQVEITIGRGFDLLQNCTDPYPCKIRDTTISVID